MWLDRRDDARAGPAPDQPQHDRLRPGCSARRRSLAPAATLRGARPRRALARRRAPVPALRPDLAHLRRRPRRSPTAAASRADWWALAWLRGTELATDALWSRSPAFSPPGRQGRAVARRRRQPGDGARLRAHGQPRRQRLAAVKWRKTKNPDVIDQRGGGGGLGGGMGGLPIPSGAGKGAGGLGIAGDHHLHPDPGPRGRRQRRRLQHPRRTCRSDAGPRTAARQGDPRRARTRRRDLKDFTTYVFTDVQQTLGADLRAGGRALRQRASSSSTAARVSTGVRQRHLGRRARSTARPTSASISTSASTTTWSSSSARPATSPGPT